MELPSGWSNYEANCGVPDSRMLMVVTRSIAGNTEWTCHNPSTGAFIGYPDSSNARSVGITYINGFLYLILTLTSKSIQKRDGLTFDNLLSSSNLTGVVDALGAIDNDGTNLFVLNQEDSVLGSAVPAVLKIDPSDFSILDRWHASASLSEPVDNVSSLFHGLCCDGSGNVLVQHQGNDGTVGGASEGGGIFDKYDSAGNLITASFIDIEAQLVTGAVNSNVMPWSSIVFTGSEFLIGDTKSNRIARCNSSGIFTGYTTLSSPNGVGSDFDTGATFRIMGYIPNAFSNE